MIWILWPLLDCNSHFDVVKVLIHMVILPHEKGLWSITLTYTSNGPKIYSGSWLEHPPSSKSMVPTQIIHAHAHFWSLEWKGNCVQPTRVFSPPHLLCLKSVVNRPTHVDSMASQCSAPHQLELSWRPDIMNMWNLITYPLGPDIHCASEVH